MKTVKGGINDLGNEIGEVRLAQEIIERGQREIKGALNSFIACCKTVSYVDTKRVTIN